MKDNAEFDYTLVAAESDARTEAMTDFPESPDINLIEDNQADPDFEPCTCGCGSMICSDWVLCTGCTDVTRGTGSPEIAGEKYCLPCWADYNLDGTVDE